MKVNTDEHGILPESGLAIAATVETMVRGSAAVILTAAPTPTKDRNVA